MIGAEVKKLLVSLLAPAAVMMGIVVLPPTAWSDVCTPPPFGAGIPQCEVQKMQPVPYGAWHTKGWAYYCTGDHPFYWGLQQGFIGSYNWDESGFTGTENEFYDGPNKFDGTFTNWNFSQQNLTVELACSAVPQPGIQGCSTTGGPVGDPGCPQSNIQNHCTGGSLPLCMQTYTETCSTGVSYDCSIVDGIAWCLQCSAGSEPHPSKRALELIGTPKRK